MNHSLGDRYLPELLAPAGSLEKLKTAILYGADAVFLSGQRFGMRNSADNFSYDELEQAVSFAKEYGACVYITLNAFLHTEDFTGLADFVTFLEEIGIAAVIVSDPGVARVVRSCTNLSIHLSTQASCINSGAGQIWKDLGFTRLILGREASITSISEIIEQTGLEVEIFVHGSLCMAYSGNCTISNFTAGRDSNRGGCIQSCRFPYELTANNGSTAKRHFMSSKDLNGISLLSEIVKSGVSSLKVEGRMKSVLYVATSTKVYRQALDAIAQGVFDIDLAMRLEEELNAIPHRAYTTASLAAAADDSSIYNNNTPSATLSSHQFLGTVLETHTDEMLVRLYRPLKKGDRIEVLPFDSSPFSWQVEDLKDMEGLALDKSRQDSVVWVTRPSVAASYNVLRLVV